MYAVSVSQAKSKSFFKNFSTISQTNMVILFPNWKEESEGGREGGRERKKEGSKERKETKGTSQPPTNQPKGTMSHILV